MSEKLLVPDIGEFEKVEVIELLVKVGDQINLNDPVVTIESDKSSVEIPSTLSGVVESVNIKVGDKVSKGDLLLNIYSSLPLFFSFSLYSSTVSTFCWSLIKSWSNILIWSITLINWKCIFSIAGSICSPIKLYTK